jgi:hypothetical protein
VPILGKLGRCFRGAWVAVRDQDVNGLERLKVTNLGLKRGWRKQVEDEKLQLGRGE